MYKERCGFVCEDFPQENQKLAKEQRPNDRTKISNVFYTVLPNVFIFQVHNSECFLSAYNLNLIIHYCIQV